MAVRRFGGSRERPVEDGIEKCDQSFVAAGIVKGQARIVGPVWPLTKKTSQLKHVLNYPNAANLNSNSTKRRKRPLL